MIFKNKNILVIAAHPDDETIGCGATLALAKKNGCKIEVLFLGEGVSTRFLNTNNSRQFKKSKKKREDEAKKALESLGIQKFKFGNKLCTQFDKYPILLFVREIEARIKKFNPSIILTHCNNETNIDHMVAYKATMIACRPNAELNLELILSYEIVCSGNFYYKNKFNPNFYVDVKKTFNNKLNALTFYKNELREYPFPRSLKGIEINARFRGLQSGLELAEAFRVERGILK
jgi:LmbE family N-acetylglucosaminyl deacetylase